MNYIVFNQYEEMLDVLNFDSFDELTLFKSKNPTFIIRHEDELTEDYFEEIEDEDDSDVIIDDE
jgi:hypothetical protein